MYGVDQPLVAKQHDRLASRATRNAVLGRQLVLTGQQLAGLVRAACDRHAQPVGDLLVDRPIGPADQQPSPEPSPFAPQV